MRAIGRWPLAARRWLGPALLRPVTPVFAHGLCTETVTESKPRRQPILTKLGPDATPLQLAEEIGKRFESHDWPSRLMLDNLAVKVQTEEEARALFAQHQNYVYNQLYAFPQSCINELLQAYYRGSLDILFQVLSSAKRYRVFYIGNSDEEVLPDLVPGIIGKLAADRELERVEELYMMLEGDSRSWKATQCPVQFDAEANAALVRSLLDAGHAEAAQIVLRIATEGRSRRPLAMEDAEVKAAMGGAEADLESTWSESVHAAAADDAAADPVDVAANK